MKNYINLQIPYYDFVSTTRQYKTNYTVKPWGNYLEIGQGKVKVLNFKPSAEISVQYHTMRKEKWLMVNGTGTLTFGDSKKCLFNPKTRKWEGTYTEKIMKPGEYAEIPFGWLHHFKANEDGACIIEIWEGESDEDDIIRVYNPNEI